MKKMRSPLIINLACTGAVSDPNVNPNVPTTVERIVEDAASCAQLGVSIGHFHVRDENARPTNDPKRYARLFEALRNDPHAASLVMCASTSGRHGQTLEERAAVLNLPKDVRPDMGSLTLSSLNFPESASINHPDTIRKLAECMLARGVKPELEVFDLGMVAFAHRLIAEGLVVAPYYFNVLVGNIAGAQGTFAHLAALLSNLPPQSYVSLGGIGAAQMPAHLMAIANADGVRIGLEDNLWMDAKRTPATNSALVERLVALMALSNRPIASATEVRRLLGMGSSTLDNAAA